MAERVPILVKFPTDLLARIEAKATRAKTNRMAMIIGLVERGLAEPPAPPPKPVEARRIKVVIEPAREEPEQHRRPAYGSRLKKGK